MSEYTALFSHEAAVKSEILQLASSGCGVTALCNVLVALGVVDNEQAKLLNWTGCILRTRANDAPLSDYLLSRSVAGCTSQDLITSMETLVTNNRHIINSTTNIAGKFVSYGEIFSSEDTLHSFVTKSLHEGKALVALLNLQLLGNDAWHHQMIYGIDTIKDGVESTTHKMIYCVNPVCEYPVQLFEKMLSTDSVLLVRGDDILKRHDRPHGDSAIYDRPEWKARDVKGQIDVLVSRCKSGDAHDASNNHVLIPANYVGGLAVFSRVDQ